MVPILSFNLWLGDNWTSTRRNANKRGAARLKGSGLYLAKRGCEYITSSFVAIRTNILPSNSLTHTDEETASFGSVSVSSLTNYPFLTGLSEGIIL